MSTKKPYSVPAVVRSALRKAWLWSPMRTAALQKARVKRGLYICAICSEHTPAKSINVDHVEPVTPLTGFSTWDEFIERLFCPANNLAILCKQCHSTKTKLENAERRKSRK